MLYIKQVISNYKIIQWHIQYKYYLTRLYVIYESRLNIADMKSNWRLR